MKVNLSPSRKPGFQWLGIQGICLHQDNPSSSAAAGQTVGSHAMPATSSNLSEAASSTATGQSHSHPQLQHAASCLQLGDAILRSNSPAMSSKGLKRSTAYSQPVAEPNKRSRTQSEPLSAPPHINLGPSAGHVADPFDQTLPSSNVEICSSDPEHMQGECSPGLPEKRRAEGSSKAGLRPTPVPTTPDGTQSDAQHLQRQKVIVTSTILSSLHV